MYLSRFLTLGAAVLAAAVLAACGASPGGDAPTDASSAPPGDSADSLFPVRIDHAFGSTVIDEQPQRVATVAWANHEVPLALGVVPVIFEKATWGDDDGDGVLPWVREQLDDLGAGEVNLYDPTDGIDFEAIADAQPDVILAAYSGLTQEEYDRLSGIADVVAYPDIAWGTSYEEMIQMNAAALGLADEGEQLIAGLHEQVDAAFSAHPELTGAKALFAFFDASDLSQIGFYNSNDTRPAFLDGHGLPFADLAVADAQDNDGFYATVSSEKVELFEDVDLFITYADPSLLPTLQADPLLSQIPAIASGRVFFAGADSPFAAAANPTPLSIPATIEDYADALARAAAGESD